MNKGEQNRQRAPGQRTSGKFIDQNYVKTIGVKTKTLDKPIKVYNVDGTPNKQGTIKKYVKVNLEVHG